jgi:chromosome segregation ATPase
MAMMRTEAHPMTRRNCTRPTEDLELYDHPATIGYTAETLRVPTMAAASEPHRPEEKISLFWRVFGGTILSIAALVAIQAYQALAGNIHELRSDQNRLREFTADFVKKDEFATRTSSLWNRVQDLQNVNASVTVLGNKLSVMESQAAQAEKERKDTAVSLAQLPGLREKVGQIDENKKSADQDHREILSILAAMQSLRDKDALLEKKLRDGETERKDLMREIQILRERLAKIEGQNQSPSTGPNQSTGTGAHLSTNDRN